jgi:hypothetical protein
MNDSVLQIIRGSDIVANVGSPEEIPSATQKLEPGRYVIDESSLSGRLLPAGQTSQRWGVAIREADGRVTLEPEPPPKERVT